MNKKYPVIALIGNLEFEDEFKDVAEDLTLRGYLVFGPSIYSEDWRTQISESQEIDIKNMTKKRIEMSDEVLVINSNGYLTTNFFHSKVEDEIKYAISLNKKVNYLYYRCDSLTCKHKEKCKYDECPIYDKGVVARILNSNLMPFDIPKCEYYE